MIDCELGRIAMEEGHALEARSHLERALSDALDCRDANLEGHIHTWLAYVLHEGIGDLSNLQHYDVALDRFREGGDGRGLRTAQVYRAFAAIDFHSDADSVGQLTELLAEVRDSGDRELEVETLVAVGWGTFEQGRWGEALRQFSLASSVARCAGLANEAIVVAINRGLALDWSGDESGAWQELRRAREATEGARAIRWRAMVDTFLAGIHARRGQVLEAEEILARVEAAASRAGWNAIHRAAVIQRGQVELAKGVLPPTDPSSGIASDEAPSTLMFRYLVHCIERQRRAASGVSTELRVRADGSSFRCGSEEWCALPRGPAIRHVLTALATKRLEEPGVTLSRENLLEIGWPGQRVQEQAGAFRVHNVIKRLRKVGLRHAIQTDDSGYRLDPSISVTLVPL